MATKIGNVIVVDVDENGQYKKDSETRCTLSMSRQGDSVVICIYRADDTKLANKIRTVQVSNDAEYCRLGKQGFIITTAEQKSILLKFDSIHNVKSFQFKLKELQAGLSSVFTERTDTASAVQYFQFYGYLSQQQNMMQDYIRTSTYQRAMLSNVNDFLDKVVLDVGAGSGILSFFAIQAGARKVYAIEASNMAEYCEQLVQHNKLQDKIIVIPGKVEEVTLPEQVDTIISEPMGYMLFNERMLESFLHAKKWLRPKTGKMFPTQGDLHVAPFTDEALYLEQFSKANFWYQESFHGVNLTCLRDVAAEEYFKQPIVDTFDIRMCLAKSIKYSVDFLTADETDLHVIDIPLNFTIHQAGLVHGLAFWFDVAFLGTVTPVWLSTCPTETLTHWYQVRCLLQTPVLVKQGQQLTGKCILTCNKRQSYDVDIELNIPGTSSVSKNTLDLKNPFFRYTGQQPAAQPGTQTQSPSDAYWNSLMTGGQSYNGLNLVNGQMGNGDPTMQLGGQGMLQSNFVQMSGAPINPGSIPSVLHPTTNSSANRTSIGGGISPINFTQNMMAGSSSSSSSSNPVSVANFPTSNQFMIGDYVMPGNIGIPGHSHMKS